MGMNLRRPGFLGWLNDVVGEQAQQFFVARLNKHLGHDVPFDDWSHQDGDFPRVGTYTTYEVFRLSLSYLTQGDFQTELDDEEDVEIEALAEFRESLPPAASLKIEGADHLIEADSETVFVPASFDEPFHYLRARVMSKTKAEHALEEYAAALGFNLASQYEEEFINDKPSFTTISRNVARILYQFFVAVPDACVEFA